MEIQKITSIPIELSSEEIEALDKVMKLAITLQEHMRWHNFKTLNTTNIEIDCSFHEDDRNTYTKEVSFTYDDLQHAGYICNQLKALKAISI